MHKTVVETTGSAAALVVNRNSLRAGCLHGTGPPSARAQADQTTRWLLMLRFFQLLFNFGFFVANIAQMTLEKRHLGLLRIRLVVYRLTPPVLGPGLFCLADLAKQVIFLFLELNVAGLQGLRAIGGGLLLCQCGVVLCVALLLMTSGFLLLLLICCVIGGLLGRI